MNLPHLHSAVSSHALQLRQAKLSFPSVHLIVGVCSDALVREHKSRTVMAHAERCESVRHCRWVDEVAEDAPWVIDADFLTKYQIDYVAHDEDPYKGVGTDDVYSFVKFQGRVGSVSHSCRVKLATGKFIPTRRTPGVSTSELIERMVSGYRKGEFDKKLENMGHPELKSRPSTPQPHQNK
jgi:choline-phosphate cytidylyltransferase